MKRGFTLLELIVVIIIIGILATLGFTQYTKVIEKGRTAEAKTILGQLRNAEIVYYQEHGAYTGTIGDLYVEAPIACVTTHYFKYDCNTGIAGECRATRCLTTESGKTPGCASAYVLRLTAEGAWGGDAGYY